MNTGHKHVSCIAAMLFLFGCKTAGESMATAGKSIVTPVVIFSKALEKVVTEDSLVSKNEHYLVRNLVVEMSKPGRSAWLGLDTVFIADTNVVCRNGIKGSDRWHLVGNLDSAAIHIRYQVAEWNGDTVHIGVGTFHEKEKNYRWLKDSLM